VETGAEVRKMIKILIVDDELWIRHGIREQLNLTGLGIEIVGEAGNGRQAVEMIGKHKPDILLTDVRMPIMDGIELIKYVFDNDLEIKTAIISGYSDFEYAKKAISFGVSAYILKPIDENELKRTVAGMIESTDAERQDVVEEKEYSSGRISNFVYCVENLQEEEVFAEIEYLFRGTDGPTNEPSILLRNNILSLVFALNKALANYGASVEHILREHDIPKKIINESRDLRELKDYFREMVTSLMQYIRKNKKSAVKSVIEEALVFIGTNYCEDISLQLLSDKYYLNTAYLSRTFKSVAGMNFNEYLTKTRMEAAAQLLANKKLKVKDIAKLTGYNNPNYFMKKFRSYFNTTPSRFRENL
jgi:two-component system response regulator YesN